MGLLLSDTVLIDPLLDETLRLRDGLGDWPYALEVVSHADERETADLTEWPRPWLPSMPMSLGQAARPVAPA